MRIITAFTVLAVPASAWAPMAGRPLLAPRAASVVSNLQAAATEATAALAASQAETLAAIRVALPDLAAKPSASWSAADGVSVGGGAATLEAFDAPGPNNVAWLSALNVEGKVCSLTVLNGPLSDVPHFASRCVVDDAAQTLSLFLDWRPRAYGAYETRLEDGTFPGPDVLGRVAFTYSGARQSMEDKFYTPALAAVVAGAAASFDAGGAAPAAAPAVSALDRLSRGPFAVDFVLPLTPGNVAAVAAARAQAAAAWLAWQTDPAHLHRPGAPVNAQYVYDTPKKQEMYGALLDTFTNLYGAADGAKLAAADSGPLDEAYVGGGS